jgi:hypothetical protein
LRLRSTLGCLLVIACTQDFNVFVPDASVVDGSSSDAAQDSAVVDAQADAGGEAGGGMYQCGTGTVASCDQCSGMLQPCVYCGNGSTTAGVCVALHQSCFGSAPNGFGVCACGNPSACPAGFQVCRQGSCRTCAESVNNVGSTCNSGGTCNPQDGGCF